MTLSTIEKDLEEFSDDLLEKWQPEQILQILKNRALKGEKLDMAERAKYERALGADFSDIQIYSGAIADQLTRAHRAKALTAVVGDGSEQTPVVLLRGDVARTKAHSIESQMILAHEFEHVKQAQEGVHAKSEFDFESERSEHEHGAEAAEQRYLDFHRGAEVAVTQVSSEEVVDRLVEAYARYLVENDMDDRW